MDQNQSFQFNLNVAGIRAASGGGPDLPEGFFMGSVTDAFGTTASTGRAQITFKVTVTDDAYKGTIRTTRLNVPQGADDNVRYYWRALLESLGYSAAQVDQGDIGVTREVLVGRTCHFFYKPGDKDAGVWDEFQFLSPQDWTSKKAAMAAAPSTQSAIGSTVPALGASAPIAPTVTVAAPVNTGIGGNAMSGDSLIAALNR
jgi:hypothetical protein